MVAALIGLFGGLIVMAYDEGETDSVLYSWDQGITWKTVKVWEIRVALDQAESTLSIEAIDRWVDDLGGKTTETVKLVVASG